jgi:precorrin-2 dehydrogenase/sirohydrochlorin ferrochelatase
MRYPLFLDLTNQPVVVIGAGTVAARKIRKLVAAKASVTVISPRAIPAIQRLTKVRWLRRAYRPGDLRHARLVVAATDDEQLNQRVCLEAKRRGLLVNCVAPPEAGNFIVPSVVKRGSLTIAISTGGVSPALAKQIRRELEEYFTRSYAQIARRMGRARKKVGATVASADERRKIYRAAVKQWRRRRARKII